MIRAHFKTKKKMEMKPSVVARMRIEDWVILSQEEMRFEMGEASDAKSGVGRDMLQRKRTILIVCRLKLNC